MDKQIEEMADILCESKDHNCNGEDCKCIKQATDLYNANCRKVVTCKECIHRGTTNCALYYGTIVNESETSVIFGGACHSDDFFCKYGENKPE